MVEDVIRAKIRALIRSLDRVRDKLPSSAELLAADADLQDIVVVNLERAVQQSVDIAAYLIADRGLPAPSSMAASFALLHEHGWITAATAASLKAATGFRNIAVHEYEKLNWDIVHTIGSARLDDFRRYIAELRGSGLIEL